VQPLTLHLQGLHSFRKPTRIDLDRLGEHGLFGVFGPIGSGKSTLLDAMTLALYGQIDRLTGRSKRGILNHQSRRCEVRFRFRLGDTVWETQRAYRRGKDDNPIRVHSRLTRVQGADLAVVADKEREVNQRVEDLLGLSAADFMRAVVLPQGRFMQFLQLQGSDRRRMLQRIFHLEAFGEGLRSRVKRESTEVDARLQRVLGELDGLGVATPEAVTDAEATWRTAEAEATRLATVETEQRARLEALQAAAAHHRRRQEAVQALARHEEHADAHTASRAALTTARAARPLRALGDESDAARQAKDAAHTVRQDAERAHDTAQQAQKDALAARAALLEQAQDRPDPALARRTLQDALAQQETLAETLAALADLERRATRVQRRLRDDDTTLDRLERELEELVAERTTARARFAELAVPGDLRQRMQRAEQNRVLLETARERAQALGDALRATRASLDGATQELRRAEAALASGIARRGRLQRTTTALAIQEDALDPLRADLEGLVRTGHLARLATARSTAARAEQELMAAVAAANVARANRDEVENTAIERPILAGILAAHLEGPCEVCGSTDHPAPAASRTMDELLAVIDARSQARAEHTAADARLERAEAEVERARDAAERLSEDLPMRLGTSDPEAIQAMITRLEVASRTLRRGRERTAAQLRALEGPLAEARDLVAAATSRAEALTRRQEQDERELHASKAQEGRAWGAMMDALGDDTLFDLPRILATIQANDAERERLEPALGAVEKALDQVQTKWERRRAARAERRAEEAQIATEREGLEGRRRQLAEALAPYAGRALARELEELERTVQAERQAMDQAQTAVEDTTRAFLRATDARAAARAQATAAERRLERAEAALHTALAAAGVADVPALADTLPGADLDALEAELRAWETERTALQRAVAELDRTDHPVVSEEELAEARQAFDATVTERRAADDARVRAAEQHRRLSANAARHDVLEGQRAALSERASRLGELHRLLRGDRFVEYVANDHLADLVREASAHLGRLTRTRYALDLDADGTFLVTDLDAGGATRPASSLSGGETFLASLALALALSTQIQRHSASPLEFFFLDEGFGSLDPESLDRVMTAIEGLAAESRVIGLISHVGAVRERVPRRLELSCPRDGSGTVVRYRES
jgi:exonuclease SbcC